MVTTMSETPADLLNAMPHITEALAAELANRRARGLAHGSRSDRLAIRTVVAGFLSDRALDPNCRAWLDIMDHPRDRRCQHRFFRSHGAAFCTWTLAEGRRAQLRAEPIDIETLPWELS